MKKLISYVCIATLYIMTVCSCEATNFGFLPQCADPIDDIRAWLYSSIDDLGDAIKYHELHPSEHNNIKIHNLEGRIYAFRMCVYILSYDHESNIKLYFVE